MSTNPLTSPPAAPPAPDLPPLVITPAIVTLSDGESAQFSATLNGQPVSPKWSSSDPSIATVRQDGTVQIVPGDATQPRGTTICASLRHSGGISVGAAQLTVRTFKDHDHPDTSRLLAFLRALARWRSIP